MLALRAQRNGRIGALPPVLVIGAIGILVPAQAQAHFHLDSPPSPASWWTQLGDGTPQKTGPCGNEATAGTAASGIVTPYQPGQTIMLQWTETVSHTGWFRIALSYNNRTDLTDPPVAIDPTTGLSTDAGIENPPVPPVLVDGLFKHQQGQAGVVYNYSLTLPTTPCAKCTLQILQFMADHGSNLGNNNPDGYFYHHCADISIAADGGTAGGSSSSSGGSDASVGVDASHDATASNSSSSSGGGGNSSGGNSSSGANASSSSGATAGSSGGHGSSSSSGSAAGGSSGSGGTTPGSSGSSGSSGPTGDDAGPAGAGADTSSSGGGCALGSGGGTPAAVGLAGLLAFAAVRRRRRRN
jgi:MYXO-CTERM domain-containing protein